MTAVVPLKRVAGINLRDLPEATDPDYEFRYIDIGTVGRGRLVASPQPMRFGDAPSRARRLVNPGDTIVSTVRTYLRAVWPVRGSTADLVVSTGFAVLTPSRALHPGFLGWLAQSDSFIEEVVGRSVGVSYPAISPSQLGEVPVPVPSLMRQVDIADFLDTSVHQLDEVRSRRNKIADLLADRTALAVETELADAGQRYGLVPLRRRCGKVEVGIVVTPAAWYADEGVMALRGTNVKPFEIELTDVVRISHEGHEFHRKSRLAAGDVVVVRTGNAGVAAVVPAELEGANCIDLVIVRRSPNLLPEFLALVLNSTWARRAIAAHSVGTIQSHFNVSAMRELMIPDVPLAEQRAMVDRLSVIHSHVDNLVGTMTAQAERLHEHRQALIDAAVSGRLDVTTGKAA